VTDRQRGQALRDAAAAIQLNRLHLLQRDVVQIV